MSLTKDLTIRTCEMHTGGEAARLIVDGLPELEGNSVMEKRLCAINNYDHIRKFCMLEPRGHNDMYGALVVKPSHPEARIGAIYMDTHHYAEFCGHATIAVARYALEHSWVPDDQRTVPETQVNLEAPCGLVRTFVEYDGKRAGRVRFHSVPSFVFTLDVDVDVPEFGKITVDIVYGGVFFAIVRASSIGLDVNESRAQDLIRAGDVVRAAVRQQVKVYHPVDSNLGYVFGVMLTDDKDADNHSDNHSEPMANVVVFSGQADRSPCGSGTTARIALQYAKGQIVIGQERISQNGLTGSCFTAKVHSQTTCGDFPAVVVEVSGKAHYTGSSVFTLEEDDEQRGGFKVR